MVRYLFMAAVFTAILMGMFHYLEKGEITKHSGISQDEKKFLRHLPKL